MKFSLWKLPLTPKSDILWRNTFEIWWCQFLPNKIISCRHRRLTSMSLWLNGCDLIYGEHVDIITCKLSVLPASTLHIPPPCECHCRTWTPTLCRDNKSPCGIPKLRGKKKKSDDGEQQLGRHELTHLYEPRRKPRPGIGMHWNLHRNLSKVSIVSGIKITSVVFCLHLSVPAKMFNGCCAPEFFIWGHWSMSTRRKSISIPDVPLKSVKNYNKIKFVGWVWWYNLDETQKSPTFVTFFLCSKIVNPAPALQKLNYSLNARILDSCAFGDWEKWHVIEFSEFQLKLR